MPNVLVNIGNKDLTSFEYFMIQVFNIFGGNLHTATSSLYGQETLGACHGASFEGWSWEIVENFMMYGALLHTVYCIKEDDIASGVCNDNQFYVDEYLTCINDAMRCEGVSVDRYMEIFSLKPGDEGIGNMIIDGDCNSFEINQS